MKLKSLFGVFILGVIWGAVNSHPLTSEEIDELNFLSKLTQILYLDDIEFTSLQQNDYPYLDTSSENDEHSNSVSFFANIVLDIIRLLCKCITSSDENDITINVEDIFEDISLLEEINESLQESDETSEGFGGSHEPFDLFDYWSQWQHAQTSKEPSEEAKEVEDTTASRFSDELMESGSNQSQESLESRGYEESQQSEVLETIQESETSRQTESTDGDMGFSRETHFENMPRKVVKRDTEGEIRKETGNTRGGIIASFKKMVIGCTEFVQEIVNTPFEIIHRVSDNKRSSRRFRR